VAVAECAVLDRRGFAAETNWGRALGGRPDLALFGEGPSRIVVSCRPEDVPVVAAAATQAGVGALPLGQVGGDRLVWPGAIDLAISQVQAQWSTALDAC
jgi:hypothetical protein